jgi:hypothetical protein
MEYAGFVFAGKSTNGDLEWPPRFLEFRKG